MRDFINLNLHALTEEAIEVYEQAVGESLYAGDERRIMINTAVYLASVLFNKQNMLMNQNFVQYAKDEYLDILGAERDVYRLTEQRALTTLKFTLSAPQPKNIVIPIGTRATPDGVLFFETVQPVTIEAGNMSGTASAQSTLPGAHYNGFPPGTIKMPVDLIPFVQSVENTDMSQGGASVESDDSFRERILLKLSTLSTAGAEMTYRYLVLSADSTISDLSIISPSPGVVEIGILLRGGEVPGQPVIDRVIAALTPKDVRPLTDNVIIRPAEPVLYDIDLVYYINEKNAMEASKIAAEIEASVGEYEKQQRQHLVSLINPDTLRKYVLKAGAYKIDIASPVFTQLSSRVVTIAENIRLTYGGLIG